MLRCPHPHARKYAPVRAASQALQPPSKNFTYLIYGKKKAGPSAGTNRLFLYQDPARLFLDSRAALFAAVLVGRAFALGRIASILLAASLFLAGLALRALLGSSLSAVLLAILLAASAIVLRAASLALSSLRACASHFLASGIADSSAAAILGCRRHLFGSLPVCSRSIVITGFASHKAQSRQRKYKNQFFHSFYCFNWSVFPPKSILSPLSRPLAEQGRRCGNLAQRRILYPYPLAANIMLFPYIRPKENPPQGNRNKNATKDCSLMSCSMPLA